MTDQIFTEKKIKELVEAIKKDAEERFLREQKISKLEAEIEDLKSLLEEKEAELNDIDSAIHRFVILKSDEIFYALRKKELERLQKDKSNDKHS